MMNATGMTVVHGLSGSTRQKLRRSGGFWLDKPLGAPPERRSNMLASAGLAVNTSG